MLRGVDRTAEAVNTLPWLERRMLDVGLKSDFSDEKWIGLIKSAVFAGAKSCLVGRKPNKTRKDEYNDGVVARTND